MTPVKDDAVSRLRHFAGQVASRRRSPAASGAALAAIKRFQRERLAMAHADLLQSERYRLAARFFLDELYGTKDFSYRDEDLARMIPSMSKLLPAAALGTIANAIELDAISEELDEAMAVRLEAMGQAPGLPGPGGAASAAGPLALDEQRYLDVYRQVGRRDLRERQIGLVEEIGKELDRLVGKPFLYRILKGMEGPARLAGLGRMQSFLVSGFEAFRKMGGADEFVRTVASRERALMDATFADAADTKQNPPV
jgi:hypothetical protein